MRIAVVAHGRFHSFDLVRALLERGADVVLLTNYPKWAVRAFGIPRERVRSLWLHGFFSKLAERFQFGSRPLAESILNPVFGKWAERQLRREAPDVVYVFSGVAEEILRSNELAGCFKLVVRGSSHIRTQDRLLAEEEARAAHPIDRPNRWIVEREEREYGLADRVVVLSTFAHASFLSQGHDPQRLELLPLGAATAAFRPGAGTIAARRERILSGAPLRVLYVGALSYRKGLVDIRQLVERSESRFRFRFIGNVTREARGTVAELAEKAEFLPRRPQRDLPAEYSWGDVLIFPTVEDGYAVILAQAYAAGLPILTTPNCAGPDLVEEGRTGWVLPIRRYDAFLERLRWCDSHREELAEMVTAAYDSFRSRDWSDVAADLIRICQKLS